MSDHKCTPLCGTYVPEPRNEPMSDHIATPKNTMVLAVRVAELEAKIAELEAKLDAVEAEVNNIDEAFSHRYTTSHEAYRNIRSIVQALRKALAGEAR